VTVAKKFGRYDIVRTLGKGAMGMVYEGRDSVLQRRVAIKTIIVENLDSKSAEEYEARFRTEALAAARLLHPNIVPVFDFGRHDDIAFLVMQFIEGDDLKHHIDRGDRFTPQHAVAMVLDLLSALDHAHENNIVHRDIKPANMLIEKGRVKLTDFGVARIQDPDAANKTQVGAGGIGTPRYMSPEQAQGQRVDVRSDLFSAGIVLYELLAGVRPFDGDNPFAIIHQIVSTTPPPPTYHNPRLPQAIDAVVSKALAKNRDERFSSAREFAVALKAATKSVGGGSSTVPGVASPGATLPGVTVPGVAGRSATSPSMPGGSTISFGDDAEATRLPGQTLPDFAGHSGISGLSVPSSSGPGSLKLREREVVSQEQTVISPQTARLIGEAAVAAKLEADQQARAAEEAAAAQARAAAAAKAVERLEAEKQFFVAKAEAEAKARLKAEEAVRQAPRKSKAVPMAIAGVFALGAIGAAVMFMGKPGGQGVEQQARLTTPTPTPAAPAPVQVEKPQAAPAAKVEPVAPVKPVTPPAPTTAPKSAVPTPAPVPAPAKPAAPAPAPTPAAAPAPAPAPVAAPEPAPAPAPVATPAPAPVAPAPAPAAPPPNPAVLLAQAQDAERAGNIGQAVGAYRRAAAAGSGVAARRLGELYTKGEGGVERDMQQATFWNNRARSLGEQVQQSAGPCALKAGTTC